MSESDIKGFAYIYLTLRDCAPEPRRELIERRAVNLGIEIVGEFIEYGPLPDSAYECPEFQNMLTAMRVQRDIGAVFVPRMKQTHNHRLDAHLSTALHDAGVRLISGTEDIDSTPIAFLVREMLEMLHEAQYGHLRKHRRRATDAA